MKKKHIKWWILPVVIIISVGLLYAYIATKPKQDTPSQNSNPIRELKKKEIGEGYYTFRAYVVDQEQCVCPENALCEPCYNWITISDTNNPPKQKDALDANQLRIYTDEAGILNTGMDYEFKIFISTPSSRSDINHPNGIDLVEYN